VRFAPWIARECTHRAAHAQVQRKRAKKTQGSPKSPIELHCSRSWRSKFLRRNPDGRFLSPFQVQLHRGGEYFWETFSAYRCSLRSNNDAFVFLFSSSFLDSPRRQIERTWCVIWSSVFHLATTRGIVRDNVKERGNETGSREW